MDPLLSTSPVIKEADSEEVAVEEGLEQGEALCQQVGLSLSRVVSIEEIIDDEEAPEADKEDDEEEEEKPEVTTYKFEVECIDKKAVKSAKK